MMSQHTHTQTKAHFYHSMRQLKNERKNFNEIKVMEVEKDVKARDRWLCDVCVIEMDGMGLNHNMYITIRLLNECIGHCATRRRI